MDSERTSPIESQNIIVNQKLGVNDKMDIHKGIEKNVGITYRTIQKQKEEALRSLNQKNMFSRSPTKNFIITSQIIGDTNYNRRNSYK